MTLIQKLRRLWIIAGCRHPLGKQFHMEVQGAEVCLCTQCGRVAWVLVRGRQYGDDTEPSAPLEPDHEGRIPMI